MAAAVKAVTSGMQKTASTLLIVFVGITLVLFAMLRIYNTGRVIQMNMEISLIMAHILLLYGGDPEMIVVCKVISFLIHLFHVTCFVFMFLEALYTYSLVAFVVKKDGLLTKVRHWRWVLIIFRLLYALCRGKILLLDGAQGLVSQWWSCPLSGKTMEV